MKRVVISLVLTLLIILLVGLGFYYYNKSSFFKSDPVAAIPPDAPLFLQSNHAGKTFTQIFSNEAWKSLHPQAQNGSLGFMDSLFRQGNEFSAAWEQQPLYISLHVTKATNFDYLFLMNTSSVFSDAAIEQLAEKISGRAPSKRRYENVTIREMTVPSGNFAYAISNGVFVASFTSFLVEDAIRQLKTGTSVAKSSAFKIAQESTPVNDVACFVNYQALGNFTANYGTAGADILVKYLASFASWSVLDARVQTHSILLNGFTSAGDAVQLTNLFKKQFPVENKLAEIIPDRTSFLLNYGFSNSEEFFNAAHAVPVMFDDSVQRNAAITQLNRKYHINLEDKMFSWMSNNLALVITEPGNVNFSNNSFLCAAALSAEDAKRKLETLRTAINKVQGAPDKQETYRNHTIGFLKIPDVAALCYGKLFSRMNKFYYTTVRNYVVAGNTASALRSFIDDYEDKNTLALSSSGKEALSSLSNTHNFFIYMNLPATRNIAKAYALPEETGSRSDDNLLNAFSSFTFSLSNETAGLHTSILWNRRQTESKDIRLVASAQLDSSITMQPCVFSLKGTGQVRIAVQDALNQLYLLDETGEVLWKKALTEKISGEIHPVDYFKNGDVQLLFNTASTLHLVDLTGVYTGNYPIRLPSPAAAGMTVLPPDAANDTRMFVYCTNGLVYAYELSGKPLNDWLYNTSFPGAEHPMEPFVVKGKTLLLLYSSKGEIKCLDETGNDIALWANAPVNGIQGTLRIFTNDSLHEQFAALRDAENHLVILKSDGSFKKLEFPVSGAVFDFHILQTAAGAKDVYAFCVGDTVKGFDENKNPVFVVVLPGLQQSFFQHPDADPDYTRCALVSMDGKTFQVSVDGSISGGFPIKGSTKIGSTQNSTGSKITWVTGDRDGNLYIYEGN